MSIKYTNDGKKVKVIGKLNSEEYGIELPEEKVKNYYKFNLESKEEQLQQNCENRSELEQQIEELKEKI